MSPDGDLTRLIREQIEIERQSVERLSDTEKKVGSSAAKLLLTEMRMDSQKHASVLEAVLEVLTGGPTKPLWERALDSYVDPIILKREIENHKTLGKSMLTHIQGEIDNTRDEAIRTLLQHLAEDEKRHDEILSTIAEKCYKII